MSANFAVLLSKPKARAGGHIALRDAGRKTTPLDTQNMCRRIARIFGPTLQKESCARGECPTALLPQKPKDLLLRESSQD
jgi:hypothetical protein